jgi:predicted transcriptional regulator
MGFRNGQVHIGEAIDSYHSRPEISASMVKTLIQPLGSPEHFHWEHILGRKRKATSAMDFGTAVHEDQLLAIWDQTWKEIPKEALSSNGARRGAAWDQFKAENQGVVLLKSDQVQGLNYIREAIAGNPIARKLLENRAEALTELTITAEAPLLDGSYQPVRGRIDLLSQCVIDFKTISDFDDRTIGYRPLDHKWDVQAVMYQLLVESIRNGELPEVHFIVVESSEPYRCEVFQPRGETLAGAAIVLQDAIEEIVARTRSGNWHRDGWPDPYLF